MSEKDGGSAFPCPGDFNAYPESLGMTLRDYFAAQAMQAFCHQAEDAGYDEIAIWAYGMADAMLRARGGE